MKKRLMAMLAAAARVGSSKDETSEAGAKRELHVYTKAWDKIKAVK